MTRPAYTPQFTHRSKEIDAEFRRLYHLLGQLPQTAGEQGPPGADGAIGPTGPEGPAGPPGGDADVVVVQHWFAQLEYQWDPDVDADPQPGKVFTVQGPPIPRDKWFRSLTMDLQVFSRAPSVASHGESGHPCEENESQFEVRLIGDLDNYYACGTPEGGGTNQLLGWWDWDADDVLHVDTPSAEVTRHQQWLRIAADSEDDPAIGVQLLPPEIYRPPFCGTQLSSLCFQAIIHGTFVLMDGPDFSAKRHNDGATTFNTCKCPALIWS